MGAISTLGMAWALPLQNSWSKGDSNLAKSMLDCGVVPG